MLYSGVPCEQRMSSFGYVFMATWKIYICMLTIRGVLNTKNENKTWTEIFLLLENIILINFS